MQTLLVAVRPMSILHRLAENEYKHNDGKLILDWNEGFSTREIDGESVPCQRRNKDHLSNDQRITGIMNCEENHVPFLKLNHN